MSTFTGWGDLFKFATDHISEDFHYDKNFLVKAKTKNSAGNGAYSFKVEQSKPDENGQVNNSLEVKHTIKHQNVDYEGKYKSGGKVSCEIGYDLSSLNDQLNGWTYVVNADLVSGKNLDKSDFSSTLKYEQANMQGQIKCDHGTVGEVETEWSFKPQADSDYVVGGDATFNFKKTQLASLAVGVVGRLNPTFSWGFKNWSEDGKKFGNFKFFTHQAVNPDTDVATEIGYSIDTKELSASAGFTHRCCADSTWRGKLTSDGLFALSWKRALSLGTPLTISTVFDLGDKALLHNNPHPFGIALEGTF